MAVKAVRGNTEILPIVEPNGLVIGRSSRKACHSHPDLLHPVVHLHIIDPYDNIYLQKRSASKDLYPGRWDTAVGGHVTPEDLMGPALFLASDASDFVNGHILYVDGGILAYIGKQP